LTCKLHTVYIVSTHDSLLLDQFVGSVRKMYGQWSALGCVYFKSVSCSRYVLQ